MAAEWIQVSLRSWAPDRVVGADFLDTLGLDQADGLATVVGTSPGQSSLVYLVDERLETYAGVADPSGALGEAVDAALRRGAEWLRSRPPDVFERGRADGIRIDIFVGSWIDQDQFDLELPAEFLLACGEAGLGITIVTND